MKRAWYACVALSVLAGAVLAYGADKPSPLQTLIYGRDPVKVYLDQFLNDTDNDGVSPDVFKASLTKALLAKHTIHFEVIDSSLQSAITFSGRIEKFFYAVRDPLLDKQGRSLTSKHEPNFAEIRISYAVTNPLTSEAIVKDVIHTIVMRDMTREESVKYAFDKVARMIVKRTFGSGRIDKPDADTD